MGKAQKLETNCGNSVTMNFNDILYQNVMTSQYFKNLYILKTFDEVVNEIEERVFHLEPFLTGTTTVSSAFCLLYKLWTLKVTVNQMDRMVQYPGNVYVRCIGFLYLRYTYPPAKLMEWFEDFLEDDELVKVRQAPSAEKITVGKFLTDMLLNKKYFNTQLPPIPVPVMKNIEETLKALKAPPPKQEEPSRRSRSPSPRRRSPSSRRRSRSRSRSRDRRRSRSRDRDSRRRSRSRDRRDRRRSRSRSRSRDRRSSRSRSRDSRRYRDHDRRDRRRSRSRSRDRKRDSRSRSRDRKRSRSRDRR